jgi:DNA-binding MarR family transcriptional regulator
MTNDPAIPKRRSLPVLNDDPRGWVVKVLTTSLRFHARMERRMAEALAVHGLTLPQFDVLATLWHGEGITQQELAERLLVTKGNVVGLIDRVSAAGWVERRPDPEDRRANRLYLTDAGRTILARAWPCQIALNEKIFGSLSEAELRVMHGFLERLEDASKCPPGDASQGDASQGDALG